MGPTRHSLPLSSPSPPHISSPACAALPSRCLRRTARGALPPCRPTSAFLLPFFLPGGARCAGPSPPALRATAASSGELQVAATSRRRWQPPGSGELQASTSRLQWQGPDGESDFQAVATARQGLWDPQLARQGGLPSLASHWIFLAIWMDRQSK